MYFGVVSSHVMQILVYFANLSLLRGVFRGYLIKSLINKVIDFVCIGYSEKEIKHKKSIASKTVDFLSDLSDIIPKSKDK